MVIKRIVAVGGQKVSLKLGNGIDDFTNFYYYINDVLLEESYIYSRDHMNLNYFNRFCNNLNEDRNFDVSIVMPGIEAEFVVPDGHVFVLGDNRYASADSVKFGTVNKDKIYGKVVLSYEYNQTFLQYIWQRILAFF